MWNNKAQKEGKPVAIIVLLIALFMVFYIMFLPPADRNALLNINNESTSASAGGSLREVLSVNPGIVSPGSDFNKRHEMQPVNLFIKSEPTIENLASSLVVSNSLTSKSFPSSSFTIRDSLSDLQKVILSFSVSEGNGQLKLFINDHQFYSESLESGVKIVEVPISYVAESNEIRFETSSPGLSFWKSNKYVLRDIIIKEDFEKVNAKEERQFNIAFDEKAGLSKAVLKYYKVCNSKLQGDSAKLKIFVNEKSSFEGMIKCATLQESVEIDPGLVKDGINSVMFVLEDEGSFSFNQLVVETAVVEKETKGYTFSLSRKEYGDVLNGDKEIMLRMNLAETTDSKKNAKIILNDGEIMMSTDQNSFTRDVSDYVVEGTNFLKIIPSNTFRVNGLTISLS